MTFFHGCGIPPVTMSGCPQPTTLAPSVIIIRTGCGNEGAQAQTSPAWYPPAGPPEQFVGPTGYQGCGLLSAPPHCPTVQACPQPQTIVGPTGYQGCIPPLSAPPHCPTVQECHETIATVCTQINCGEANAQTVVGPTGYQGCGVLSAPPHCPTVQECHGTAATVCTQVNCDGPTAYQGCTPPLSAPPNCPTVQACHETIATVCTQVNCGGANAQTVVGPTAYLGCTPPLSAPPHCPTVNPPCTIVGPTGYQGCGTTAPQTIVGPTGYQGCIPPLSAPPHCPTVQVCPTQGLTVCHPVCMPTSNCGHGRAHAQAQIPTVPVYGCIIPTKHCTGIPFVC